MKSKIDLMKSNQSKLHRDYINITVIGLLCSNNYTRKEKRNFHVMKISRFPLPPPFISPIHPTPSNNFFPHVIDHYYSHKDEIREIRVIIFYREIAINHRAFNTHRLNWRDTEVFSTAKFHRDRVARRVDTRWILTARQPVTGNQPPSTCASSPFRLPTPPPSNAHPPTQLLRPRLLAIIP